MSSSPSPKRILTRFDQKPIKPTANTAAEFESTAQLIEDFIPKFKGEPEKQFYRECVQSYRAAARDIRRAWSDERGQDIAEYAVMLAVILVIVVGTIRLIGSNANTVFSQAASSIQ